MKPEVVSRHKYLAIAEMVKGLLEGEGIAAVVRARDPFGAFYPGPHLARFQPTPCSVYEVLVPEEEIAEARDIVEGITREEGEERRDDV